MKTKIYTSLLALCTLFCFTGKAQFSQPGELDTTFNFGRPHSFFTVPANPEPGEGADNIVNSFALQPDGKILIGGDFTRYNGTTRNFIARLNADGSLDATFNPGMGANNNVFSVALQPDGKVLIGGWFTSFNGTPRNRIARMNPDGSLDATFNPGMGANNNVRSFALQPDGKVLIGGDFTSYNGTPCNRIARLNADGSLDATFNPGTGASSTVISIALQPDGKVLIGGQFSDYNGFARSSIARLNANGSLDATFFVGSGANDRIRSLALQPDGKVMIGGDFTSYNGTASNRIGRLNANGSLDATFNPGTGLENGGFVKVNSLVLQPDGKLLIGGDFTRYNGTVRNRIARLNPDGSLDANFNIGTGMEGPASTFVSALALQPNGKLLISGFFNSYNGIPCNLVPRLNADGSLDASFNPGAGAKGTIRSLALQPDGKVLIGGGFTSYNGTPRNNIARLNADGSSDASFNPFTRVNDLPVQFLALQPDGKVLIVGGFTISYNGTVRNRIARLNADGSLDTTFNPGTGADWTVSSLALQPDGKVLIGGFFTIYNGTTRNKVARLNTDGTLDASFNPGTGLGGNSPFISYFALQPDGKVLIGGEFLSYNGTARNSIARLNADGSLDSSFNPGTGANGDVLSLALQPDGKVLIGGEFSSYNGTARNRIARLNSDGSLDAGFNPGTGVEGGIFTGVYSLALQSDGKLLIGGEFASYNGTTRNRIARLNTDGSLDTSFNPGNGVVGASFPSVYALALQPDGKVLIGGGFYFYNGIYRSGIARILTTEVITGSTDKGLKTEQDFSIYPVPFRNALTIKAEGPFNFEIMDVRGVMKESGMSQTTETNISTVNLATGMYLVKITMNGKSYLRKIIKE